MDTPLDLINRILADAAALKALQPQPVPAPPVPPQIPTLTTAAELTRACAQGGEYDIAPGDYVGNFIVTARVGVTAHQLGVVLKPLDLLEPTLSVPTASGSGSRFDAFTIMAGAPDREAVVIGRYEATSAAEQPDGVVIRNCVVQAGPLGGHRGIALHGSNLSVVGTNVYGFWRNGQDAQAIWIHNGPGPYLIENCHLEGSGENLLAGGASVQIPNCVPSDITIRGNTFYKPAAWKTNGASVKNSVEIKNGRRVKILNNVIDGWWPGGQAAPIQLTPRNQDGDNPWTVVEDVEISGNTVKNAPGGFAINILGTDNDNPSGQTRNIFISRSLFTDSQAGIQVLGGVAGDLTIEHNTFPAIKSKLFSFDRIAGTPDLLTRLHFTGNVARAGTYGVTGDGTTAIGLESLKAFCDLVDWSGNLIGGPSTIKWPAGQAVLTNAALMALLDPVTFKTLNGTGGY